ncbi:serine/threonine-protein kinase [Nonomuraea deserti]|uniref:serine/threonine-protein kinase n=1 Tax=Nonomuraea deserti TaxID=1848322 RepID=UPI001FE78914|nr:serine/threonine-protein kinase [Nonomuraea deserti]
MTPLLADRYRLLAELGQGGMGTVWRAMDALLQQEVAVKEVKLPPDLDAASREELTQRTLREARAAARLRSHPSIVTVHDVVLDGGRPWIVMELVQGRSLDQAVREGGPLPPHKVAWIGMRMLDALGAAHGSGVLHRDVKPANVMLTDDGRVLLTDFGIASVAGDAELTQTGFLSGSPGYIAPERLRGEADGPLADLWSLGATLFTAVEGAPPFARPNQAAVMAAVLMQEPAPTRRAGPLEPVLAALLDKDPARRCTPDQVAGWLDAIAQGNPATDPALHRQRTAPGRLTRRPRRRVVVGTAIAVALVTAAAVAMVPIMPNLIRVIGYLAAPRPTYSVPEPVDTSSPAPKRTTRDFEACDLLTAAQVRKILGGPAKRQYIVASNCSWKRDDGSNVSLAASRMGAWGVKMAHDQSVEYMKEEPKRVPGTRLRKGPKVGSEAYSFTQKTPFSFRGQLYRTDISFRSSDVWVRVAVTVRRPGFAAGDRTARLVQASLVKLR